MIVKKNLMSISLIAVFTCLLTACGCKHEWKEATCEEPKTCKICNEVEGEPLGHNWKEATCTEAKTCLTCGKTEGEKLGHRWVEATYEKPKTCTVCGLTEGEPLKRNKEITKDVVNGYNNAINNAKKAGVDADAAYNSIYEAVVGLNSALDKEDQEDIYMYGARLYGLSNADKISNDEYRERANELQKFIVSSKGDKLSALMRKFKTMQSVEGTIEEKKVSIVVNDMEAFVDEIKLQPKVVGGILAMLDIYDYSWLGDGKKLIQFTENGFTFDWVSVVDYSLKLD